MPRGGTIRKRRKNVRKCPKLSEYCREDKFLTLFGHFGLFGQRFCLVALSNSCPLQAWGEAS